MQNSMCFYEERVSRFLLRFFGFLPSDSSAFRFDVLTTAGVSDVALLFLTSVDGLSNSGSIPLSFTKHETKKPFVPSSLGLHLTTESEGECQDEDQQGLHSLTSCGPKLALKPSTLPRWQDFISGCEAKASATSLFTFQCFANY